MCIYLAALLLGSPSVAIPLGGSAGGNVTTAQNGTADSGGSPWVSTPDRRGTYDLVMSCLLTLLLCAWTAYHPNIPAKVSPWALIGRRLKWVLVAIFAPELVLVVACFQLQNAWRLMREVNAIEKLKKKDKQITMDKLFLETCSRPCRESSASQTEGPPLVRESHTWPYTTLHAGIVNKKGLVSSHIDADKDLEDSEDGSWKMSQAFFALSGGIAVQSDSFYPSKRIVFESRGILALAKLGILPRLDEDEINDRSKADVFAKVLVCLQTGWFFIQSIARLQQSLPLTLLEIHTNAHIICAFLLYAVWAMKPYDVGAPLICSDERVVNIAAFFSSAAWDMWDGEGRENGLMKCTLTDYLTAEHIRSAHQSPMIPSLSWKSYKKALQSMTLDSGRRFWPRKDNNVDDSLVEEHLRRANKAIDFMREKGCHMGWRERVPCISPFEQQPALWSSVDFPDVLVSSHSATLTECGLSKKELIVEQLLASATNTYPKKMNHKSSMTHHKSTARTTMKKSFVDSYMFFENRKLTKWPFIVFSAIYGGAHLSAWDSHFPTTGEMWAWRVSGICLAAGPFLGVVAYWLLDLISYISKQGQKAAGVYDQHLEKEVSVFLDKWKIFWWFVCKWLAFPILATSILACLSVVTVWPAARLYIVGEAFASLRSPPVGTYRTEDWLNYIPHAN